MATYFSDVYNKYEMQRIIYYSFVIDIKQQNKMAENHIMVSPTRYCHKFTLKRFSYEINGFHRGFHATKIYFDVCLSIDNGAKYACFQMTGTFELMMVRVYNTIYLTYVHI